MFFEAFKFPFVYQLSVFAVRLSQEKPYRQFPHAIISHKLSAWVAASRCVHSQIRIQVLLLSWPEQPAAGTGQACPGAAALVPRAAAAEENHFAFLRTGTIGPRQLPGNWDSSQNQRGSFCLRSAVVCCLQNFYADVGSALRIISMLLVWNYFVAEYSRQ